MALFCFRLQNYYAKLLKPVSVKKKNEKKRAKRLFFSVEEKGIKKASGEHPPSERYLEPISCH